MWAKSLRGLLVLTKATPPGSAAVSPAMIAEAPWATACGMNPAPSTLVPGSAAKAYPGRTSRLSAVRPVMAGSILPAAAAGQSDRRRESGMLMSVRFGELGRVFGELSAILVREHGINPEDRRNPLDDAAGGRHRIPP